MQLPNYEQPRMKTDLSVMTYAFLCILRPVKPESQKYKGFFGQNPCKKNSDINTYMFFEHNVPYYP